MSDESLKPARVSATFDQVVAAIVASSRGTAARSVGFDEVVAAVVSTLQREKD